MSIHWSLLAPGALLLLFPTDLILSARVELRSFDRFRSLENSPRSRPWWWVPALWLDPVRGLVGAWLLRMGLVGGETHWHAVAKPEYAAAVALLIIGAIGQVFTRQGDTDARLAPMGYVAGVLFALVPWPLAAIGMVSSLLALFAFRNFPAYFASGMSTILLFGAVFDAPMMWVLPAAGVFAVPILTAFLTGGTLELPTRNLSAAPQSPPKA